MSVNDLFDEPQYETRSSRHSNRPRRPKAVLAVGLAIVVVAALLIGSFMMPLVSRIFGGAADYPGPGSGEVSISVPKGATGTQIGDILAKADVVKSADAYVSAATNDTAASAKVQAGSYTLKKQMKASDALAYLANPANMSASGVTIPEGQWVSEIIDKLSAATDVPKEDYEKAIASNTIGLPESATKIKDAKTPAEGWLFPSTYEFTSEDSAQKQLSTMVTRTKDELTKAGVPESKWEHVLTVASIIEAEAPANERSKVARVIENRLLRANDYVGAQGRLEMDSTLKYALGKRGLVSSAEQKTPEALASPYNTYKVKGLPPTPTNNPGAAAIEAAAKPEKGDWQYFVTVNLDTGETLFANTLQEQDANIAKLNTWCDANPAKCGR